MQRYYKFRAFEIQTLSGQMPIPLNLVLHTSPKEVPSISHKTVFQNMKKIV
jgi:hypothetical protein